MGSGDSAACSTALTTADEGEQPSQMTCLRCYARDQGDWMLPNSSSPARSVKGPEQACTRQPSMQHLHQSDQISKNTGQVMGAQACLNLPSTQSPEP